VAAYLRDAGIRRWQLLADSIRSQHFLAFAVG
jgi:hypothetical protein